MLTVEFFTLTFLGSVRIGLQGHKDDLRKLRNVSVAVKAQGGTQHMLIWGCKSDIFGSEYCQK